jgi:SAM-dependent methyltransferase
MRTPARQLEPVSAHVVRLAGVVPGERVLDVGCGTGNAALLAAQTGADVVGVDPAVRLLSVARERAEAAGVSADFVPGTAESLPFPDASFDAALSVFGVIFAAEPERAIGEMLRVVRPGGRVLIAAWLPTGTVTTLMGLFRSRGCGCDRRAGCPRGSRGTTATSSRRLRFGTIARVEAHEGQVQFSGESPEAFFAAQEENHPLSVGSRALLESAGAYDECQARRTLRAHRRKTRTLGRSV